MPSRPPAALPSRWARRLDFSLNRFGDNSHMTRGVMMVPPVPRKAPAARAARLGAFLRIVLALASVAPLFVPTQRVWAAKENALPEGPIVEVRVEGNVSITSDQVRAKILSR